MLSLIEKTDMSWKQLRELNCFMKQFNFKMEHEKKSHDLAKQLSVPISMDAKVFYDKDDENETKVPPTKINIAELVIETYDAMNLLTWHDGTIPEDQICIKFPRSWKGKYGIFHLSC